MKEFNIAIIGLGNIGLEVYKNIKKNAKDIRRKTGFNLNILKVSARNIKKNRGVKFSKTIFEKNISKIINDPKIDIIVELIGGSDGVAKRVVFQSIKKNKHVVTANKSLISKHGDALSVLQKNTV